MQPEMQKSILQKLNGLAQRQKEREELEQARFRESLAKLERDVGVADQYAEQEVQDTSALSAELDEAEQMRGHLNEYRRMRDMQTELDELTARSQALTDKIELARELPATILAQATIPVEGLTVEDGVPLIHGLPISNLSDGELLELCVDITVSKPGQLGIILVDGAERLDSMDVDLVGLKSIVKFTVTGNDETAGGLAVVLGDAAVQPV